MCTISYSWQQNPEHATDHSHELDELKVDLLIRIFSTSKMSEMSKISKNMFKYTLNDVSQ